MKIALFAYSWAQDQRLDPYIEKFLKTFLAMGIDVDVYQGNTFTRHSGNIGLSSDFDVSALCNYISSQRYDAAVSFNNSLIITQVLNALKCRPVSCIVDDFLHLFQHEEGDKFAAFRHDVEVILLSSHVERQLIDAVSGIKQRIHFLPPATDVQARFKTVSRGKAQAKYPISWVASLVDTREGMNLFELIVQKRRYFDLFKACLAEVEETGTLTCTLSSRESEIKAMLDWAKWTYQCLRCSCRTS